MTGPEHYQRAEHWLFKAREPGARGEGETAELCAAIGNGHATLALAAALRIGNPFPGLNPGRDAWAAVAAPG